MEGVADDAPSKGKNQIRGCTGVVDTRVCGQSWACFYTTRSCRRCISRTLPNCSRRTTRAHTGHLLVLWVWFKRHLVNEARSRVAFRAGMHACVPVCVRVYACVHCMS